MTGTFRRVGPAYVLTDDLQGTAPRRQRLTRFVEEAEMARHTALEAAGDNLGTLRGGLDALPPLDGLDLSAAQTATIRDQVYVPGTPVRVPFVLLTPAQQEYADAQVRETHEMADQAERAGGSHSMPRSHTSNAGSTCICSPRSPPRRRASSPTRSETWRPAGTAWCWTRPARAPFNPSRP